MMIRTILICFVINALLSPLTLEAQFASRLDPVTKSAVLPGWGERSLEARERGLLFTGMETALWTLTALSWVSSQHYDDELRAYATHHADVVNVDVKNEDFLNHLADYNSMTEYNDQMLRNRRNTELYSAEQGEYWEWESEDKRFEYQRIKLHRYRRLKMIEYGMGAIALNHLVSAMDVLYLKRISEKLSFAPEIYRDMTGIKVILTF